jgi:NAD(P)H-flavin reductase
MTMVMCCVLNSRLTFSVVGNYLFLGSFLKQKIWHVKGGKGFRVLLTLKQSCRVLFLASTYLLSIKPQGTQDGQLSPQVAKGLIEWSVGLALAALRPNEWVDSKLQETYDVNHNTKLFRFSFDPEKNLGLNVASCLLAMADIGTKEDGSPKKVIRPYTPISPPDSKGYFDLMIKVYPQGLMSQHIAHLKPGDTLAVKGPIPKLPYEPNKKKQIGMIAGGTGVTPMLQVLDAILSNPDDNTQVCPVVSFKPGVTLCFDGTVIAVPTDHLEFVPCTV